MFFLLIALPMRAENTVFVDAAFPYRIVCVSGWVQELKNDSMLLLKNSAAGKKTRLQLQKYSVDTGYDINNKDWSRLRFAINKELALAVGKLIFVDTSASKKLGNLRAFEIFAFFSQITDRDTMWWAEYSRWTDRNGFGYLASIIGDTTDMKTNYSSYKALLDSTNISQLNTGVITQERRIQKAVQRGFPSSSSAWYTLSGRETRGRTEQPNTILVKKNMKQFLVR
jgi:hypothetical protein